MHCEKEYRVVVTACAPFKKNETNPTQDVKGEIPDRIERPGRVPINIIKYPTDFRNVITDMDIIPTLWNGNKRVFYPDAKEGETIYIDAMLHMGMSFSEHWSVEAEARRDGYDWVGDDGVPLPKHNGQGGEWKGLPQVLTPMFDLNTVVQRIHKDLPNTPAVVSHDGGLLYCEFIYYTSLAALYRQGKRARAMFMHHPGKKTTGADIQQGADVAVSVICSMIDQLEEV